MKKGAQLLQGIVSKELQLRLESQPDGLAEYSEKGFSLSLINRVKDRLNTARRRATFAEAGPVKKNLVEIIELLELVDSSVNTPVWHGYLIEGATRVEFVLVPSLSRRVIAKFDVAT